MHQGVLASPAALQAWDWGGLEQGGDGGLCTGCQFRICFQSSGRGQQLPGVLGPLPAFWEAGVRNIPPL